MATLDFFGSLIEDAPGGRVLFQRFLSLYIFEHLLPELKPATRCQVRAKIKYPRNQGSDEDDHQKQIRPPEQQIKKDDADCEGHENILLEKNNESRI